MGHDGRVVQVLLLIAVTASLAWLLHVLFAHLRQRDRAIRARAEARADTKEQLEAALQRAGSLPEHPLVVQAASAVEPRAETTPCPICEGRLHVDAHEVDDHGTERLRKLTMRCGDCGRTSLLFARIETPVVN